jgi:hypothetical protein
MVLDSRRDAVARRHRVERLGGAIGLTWGGFGAASTSTEASLAGKPDDSSSAGASAATSVMLLPFDMGAAARIGRRTSINQMMASARTRKQIRAGSALKLRSRKYFRMPAQTRVAVLRKSAI